MGFWDDVYELRAHHVIPRAWTRNHLKQELESGYSTNTIRTVPSNFSIARTGTKIGHSVKIGGDPKAWRVGSGKFELIADPDDDEASRKNSTTLAQQRANELRAGEDRNARGDDEHNDFPEPIQISLTESDRRSFEGLSPEKKAYRVVCKYFRDKYGSQVKIAEDHDGADLKVTVGDKTERIEVKGTKSTRIAWAKLKVSSQQSYHTLKTGAARMYRVVNVDSHNPSIFILEFGTHFDLIPEPRWAVKAASRAAKRYPLRGTQYRYDRPYDAVAEHEWRGLGG